MIPLQNDKAEIQIFGASSDIKNIFSLSTVRDRCKQIFLLAKEGKTHFKLNLDKLDEVAQFVCNVILDSYPTLDIPFHSQWRFFRSNKTNHFLEFYEKTELFTLREQIKAKLNLIIISVLLEGVAGSRWRYREDKKEYSLAEGQFMACFRMFMSGTFSNNSNNPLQVDAEKLSKLSLSDLEMGFQSNENNFLVGLEERLNLLHKLSVILLNENCFLNKKETGLGNILDYLLEISSCYGGSLSCAQIFTEVQKLFHPLWLGKLKMAEVNLGDTWIYKSPVTSAVSVIPFHTHAQWLTYTLLEPLAESGLCIQKINELTGLAEYRNSGLMLDSGLIELKDVTLKEKAHPIESELIVEWRAITVILLDKLAKHIRVVLGKSEIELPLAKVLEGGTWLAGKRLAQKFREGAPPLKAF